VYPAGFVYIYASLKTLTGGDIFLGQCAFVGVYVTHLAIVLGVYAQARCVPPWALLTLCLSKRVHSIFVLRLFNDCFAMAFAYLAVCPLPTRAVGDRLRGFLRRGVGEDERAPDGAAASGAARGRRAVHRRVHRGRSPCF
jgi:hypothetical protein